MTQNSLIQFQTKCQLLTQWANFELNVFLEPSTGKEHLALVLGSIGEETPVPRRMHSECMTGDTLFSQRCDCGPQIEKSLKIIGEASPMIFSDFSICGPQSHRWLKRVSPVIHSECIRRGTGVSSPIEPKTKARCSFPVEGSRKTFSSKLAHWVSSWHFVWNWIKEFWVIIIKQVLSRSNRQRYIV